MRGAIFRVSNRLPLLNPMVSMPMENFRLTILRLR